MMKKLLALLLCLVMVVSLAMPAVHADEGSAPQDQVPQEPVANEPVQQPSNEDNNEPSDEDNEESGDNSGSTDSSEPEMFVAEVANEYNEGTTVAKIGDKEYSTLEAAVSEANADDTIVLVADYTLTKRLSVNKSITIINDDEQRTLYILNTVSSNGSGRGIQVGNGATLTIKKSTNGSLKLNGTDGTSHNYGPMLCVWNGTLITENITICNAQGSSNGGGILINSTGIVNLNSGTIVESCNVNDGFNGGGVCVSASGQLNLNTGAQIIDCSAKNGGGIYCNGIINLGSGKINGGQISNCEATSNGGGVYITSTGTMNMYSGAKIDNCKAVGGAGICVYGDKEAAQDARGKLNIYDGELSNNGDASATTNAGGIYNKGGITQILDGTFYGNKSTSDSYFPKMLVNDNSGTVTISGGWFSAKVSSTFVKSEYYATGKCADAPDSKASFTVSKGYTVKFKDGDTELEDLKKVVNKDSDSKQITINGLEIEGNEFLGWYLTQDFQGAALDISKSVEFSTDVTLYAKQNKYVARLTVGEETTNKSTLKAALDDVKALQGEQNVEIYLYRDATLNSSDTGKIEYTGGTITLKMNGHSITCDNCRAFNIRTGVNFTIIGRENDDSSCGKILNGTASQGSGMIINGTGAEVTISNVVFDRCVSTSTSGYHATGGAILLTGGGSLTVTGGGFKNCEVRQGSSGGKKLEKNVFGGAVYVSDTTGTTLNLTGVSFENNKNEESGGGAIYNMGTATIADCTFKGNQAGAGGGAIYAKGTMTIGGTFTDNIGVATNASGIVNGRDINIIGGNITLRNIKASQIACSVSASISENVQVDEFFLYNFNTKAGNALLKVDSALTSGSSFGVKVVNGEVKELDADSKPVECYPCLLVDGTQVISGSDSAAVAAAAGCAKLLNESKYISIGTDGYLHSSVRFTESNNLNLSNDLKFIFNITKADGVEGTVTANFSMVGVENGPSATGVSVPGTQAIFNGLSPQYIGTEVKAELFVDGVKVDENTRSILDYVSAVYGTESGKYNDVIRDLVDYGIAANAYCTEKKYSQGTVFTRPEWLTAAASTATPDSNYQYIKTAKNPDYDCDFTAANVIFDCTNTLYVKYKMPEGCTLTVKQVKNDNEIEVEGVTVDTSVNGICYIRGIKATQYLDTYKFIVTDTVTGKTVRSMTYGIGSYAYGKLNGQESTMKTLALATYRYGLSAAALKTA